MMLNYDKISNNIKRSEGPRQIDAEGVGSLVLGHAKTFYKRGLL